MHIQTLRAYWRSNLKYLAILLSAWFGVSYLAGIIFADQLDAFSLGGFPLGFWFANQGSVLSFVLIILVYVRLMDRLDRRHGVSED